MGNQLLAALVLIILVITLCVLFIVYKAYFYRLVITSKLKKIKYGHLIMYDVRKGKVIVDIYASNQFKAIVYVNDVDTFFTEVFEKGDVGLGEMYTNNVWYSPDVVSFLNILVSNVKYLVPKYNLFSSAKASIDHDKQVVQHHYDVGNDFYESFLTDDLMAYSCGFFFCPSDDLNKAQYNKVNAIIRKLNVNPDDNILDIGCGWGRIAEYVSNTTKCNVVGTTISQEQVNYINSQSNNKKSIRGVLCHYMEMTPNTFGGVLFDKVYSIGMFEHVRCMNYRLFFTRVASIMKEGGRFVLHTITTNIEDTSCSSGATRNFLTEHIFPGGQIPKIEWVLDAAFGCGLQLVHLETLGGHHYAKTLGYWRRNLLKRKDELIMSRKYTLKTIKAYEYYMSECEAAFYNNQMQLSHFVFDKVFDNQSIVDDVFLSKKACASNA